MTDPSSRVSVASKLRLLLAKRYLELLFIMGVLSIPKVISFLTGGPNPLNGQGTAGLINSVSDNIVFPVCLLATLDINRSVLGAEPARLLASFRLAARAIVTYFILVVIEYGPPVVALEGIKRILVSAHVLEKENLFFNGIAFPLEAAIVRFVFIFSLPLLVFKSVANLENVRQSLKLFNKHKASLLLMLGFSLLISAIGLPESFHFINRSEYLLMMYFARRIVLILFYVLSMDYDTLIENMD